MKTLPSGMQDHLNGGVTTLCWCWLLVRVDGVTLGFTDHDEDVVVGSQTYKAATGFTASAVQTDLGLNVATLDVQGALVSDELTEADLSAGLWDDAEIQLWRVNWGNTTQVVQMRQGTIGEVKRGDFIFTSELRGLANDLNEQQGRLYSYACDADLGDSRCSPAGEIDLTQAQWHGTGAITAILDTDRWFTVSGLDSFVDQFFSGGIITFTSGDNNTYSAEVRLDTDVTGSRQIELWLPMGSTVTVGDTFSVVAGCDKIFATCIIKFANQKNFQGFPWMPSNDLITAYPDENAVNDGGSLFGNTP